MERRNVALYNFPSRAWFEDLTELEDGLKVPQQFQAAVDDASAGLVELTVVVGDGRAHVSEMHITEPEPGAGVQGVTLDRVPLQKLTESALRVAARFATRAASGDQVPAERLGSAARTAARRRRVNEGRLARVAEAYEAGGVDQVAETEYVSERHAYRLVASARKAGLLSGEGQ